MSSWRSGRAAGDRRSSNRFLENLRMPSACILLSSADRALLSTLRWSAICCLFSGMENSLLPAILAWSDR